MRIKSKVAHYIVLAVMFVFLIILVLFPINRTIVKLLILADLFVIFTFCVFLFRKNKYFRFLIILIASFLLFMSFFNGRSIHKEVIRSEYINSLKKYEGSSYLWGGESFMGIDCSGLVRRGLIDTYIRLGFSRLSPQYVRKGIYLWFYDFSAEAMKDGYKGLTTVVLTDVKLNELDYNKIQDGDIMVTADGIHTMAYIGNQEWIQADPAKYKVIIEKAPSDENGWYKVPSVIVRWRDLK